MSPVDIMSYLNRAKTNQGDTSKEPGGASPPDDRPVRRASEEEAKESDHRPEATQVMLVPSVGVARGRGSQATSLTSTPSTTSLPSLGDPSHVHGPREALLIVALVAGAFACGGPMPAVETASQATAPPAVRDPAASVDAVVVAGPAFHTMTVTLCSTDPEACHGAQPAEEAGPVYRVSFGTGSGSVRSREQAVANLYREVRDRTGAGTRLVAVAHHLDRHSSSRGAVDPLAPPRPASRAADPLVEAAYDLIEVVDADGQVTVDVAHSGLSCKVSLAARSPDAGAGRCLVGEPERPGLHESEGRRQPERRYGP